MFRKLEIFELARAQTSTLLKPKTHSLYDATSFFPNNLMATQKQSQAFWYRQSALSYESCPLREISRMPRARTNYRPLQQDLPIGTSDLRTVSSRVQCLTSVGHTSILYALTSTDLESIPREYFSLGGRHALRRCQVLVKDCLASLDRTAPGSPSRQQLEAAEQIVSSNLQQKKAIDATYPDLGTQRNPCVVQPPLQVFDLLENLGNHNLGAQLQNTKKKM